MLQTAKTERGPRKATPRVVSRLPRLAAQKRLPSLPFGSLVSKTTPKTCFNGIITSVDGNLRRRNLVRADLLRHHLSVSYFLLFTDIVGH